MGVDLLEADAFADQRLDDFGGFALALSGAVATPVDQRPAVILERNGITRQCIRQRSQRFFKRDPRLGAAQLGDNRGLSSTSSSLPLLMTPTRSAISWASSM